MSSESARKRNRQLTDAEWGAVALAWGWSNRERDVVRYLAAGVSRKEAACELQISVSTLRTHFDRATHKAHAEDLIQLIWKIIVERDRLREA